MYKNQTPVFCFLLDSKWQELNQLTVDRQQKLEESSNNLIQFQTGEAQLKQWLVEKELMVSVLGPLSIDPNMLNTQRQQVQVSITWQDKCFHYKYISFGEYVLSVLLSVFVMSLMPLRYRPEVNNKPQRTQTVRHPRVAYQAQEWVKSLDHFIWIMLCADPVTKGHLWSVDVIV